LQTTCWALTLALNFTCSSQVTQIALLPASIVRRTARLRHFVVDVTMRIHRPLGRRFEGNQ
jgi:hypothetical protein